MMRTVRHKVHANVGKQAQLLGLFGPWRKALAGLSALTVRELHDGQPLMSWRVMTDLPFDTSLSARQMKSVQNQVHAAHASWLVNVQNRVRELITGSALDDATKTALYRINARQAWWAKELDLPWLVDGATGELAPCGDKHKSAVFLPVEAECLDLVRRLVKQAQKRTRRPDLSRVDTINLDSIVAKVQAAETGTFGWMVKVATLTRGKPVWAPLAANPYFDRLLAEPDTRLCGAIQLHLVRDHGTREPSGVAISLVAETRDAPERTTGNTLGLDWGMRHALLATSDGELLGTAMLARLAELDQQLLTLQRSLQQAGRKPTSDPAYRALRARIKGYVTNEIGRLLNRIAARDGEQRVKELAVESLDFRGGTMSRTMNRLITHTGRAVFKARTSKLDTGHGIPTKTVPSPYSSQECSGCGYVAKTNRKGSRFECGFCGKKLHADVNAARVILGRRSSQLPDHTGPTSRANTRHQLDTAHRQRWRLHAMPVTGAVPDLAGAPGATAA